MQYFGAKRLAALAGAAGLLVWASAAQAVTIDIGLAEDNASIGAITDQGTNQISNHVFGNFKVSASGSSDVVDGDLLFGNTINVFNNGVGSHDLYVYITAQHIDAGDLPAFNALVSTFGVNSLPAGGQVTSTVYLSLADAKWTGTLIGGPATFTGPGNTYTDQTFTDAVGALNSDFSVTELFKITLSTGGTQATTDVSSAGATPLPAALPLFGSVLGGGFLFRRLRNRRKA